MCELFGLSSAQPVPLAPFLAEFARRGGATADNPDGWGVAYREADRFVLEKEPVRGASSQRLAALAKARHAGLVIAHVRKANPPTALTLANTHPFVRSCCGLDWAFAHNGKIPEILGPASCCPPRQCHYAGATDSEQAFCYLLQEIARVFPQAGDPVDGDWFTAAAATSELIATHGQFNFLLSDGVHLIAHAHDRLHGACLEIEDTAVALVASEPLGAAGPWQSLGPRRLHVYRAGVPLASLETGGTPRPAVGSDQVH
jgi:glutamine amidotransferase